MYNYKIKEIVRVVDGDTMDVLIDLGFSMATLQRVRLLGLDTPETRTKDLTEKKAGLEAKNWVTEQLAKHTDWNINTFKDEKYGRILGVIYRDGFVLNEELIKNGYAQKFMV